MTEKVVRVQQIYMGSLGIWKENAHRADWILKTDPESRVHVCGVAVCSLVGLLVVFGPRPKPCSPVAIVAPAASSATLVCPHTKHQGTVLIDRRSEPHAIVLTCSCPGPQ